MKILLINLALLWPTNQNIGLKRLCLCICKQHVTLCISWQQILHKTDPKTRCWLLHEAVGIWFHLGLTSSHWIFITIISWNVTKLQERRNLQSCGCNIKHLRNKRTYPILSQNRMKIRPNRHHLIQKATHDQILLLAFLSWNCVPNFGVLSIIFSQFCPKYLDKALVFKKVNQKVKVGCQGR